MFVCGCNVTSAIMPSLHITWRTYLAEACLFPRDFLTCFCGGVDAPTDPSHRQGVCRGRNRLPQPCHLLPSQSQLWETVKDHTCTIDGLLCSLVTF